MIKKIKQFIMKFGLVVQRVVVLERVDSSMSLSISCGYPTFFPIFYHKINLNVDMEHAESYRNQTMKNIIRENEYKLNLKGYYIKNSEKVFDNTISLDFKNIF